METRGFQRPMVYDPALAGKGSSYNGGARPTQPRYAPEPEPQGMSMPRRNMGAADLKRDLGFEEADNPSPPAAGAKHGQVAEVEELRDRCRELSEELQELRGQTKRQQDALSKSDQKLQSIQNLSRSQSALMKAELQKCRRKCEHYKALAARLREQAMWLQQQCPSAALPESLQRLPTEDQAAEEHPELVQLHERWEKDVLQLQQELMNGVAFVPSPSTTAPCSNAAMPLSPSPGRTPASSPGLSTSPWKDRTAELEAEAKRYKQHAEQLAKELDKLRGERSTNQQLTPASPAQSTTTAASTSDGTAEETVALRKELEASEEKSKDQMKKLKKLAEAYKKLEADKKEAEARCKEAEAKASQPVAQVKRGVPAALVKHVQAVLASSRSQLVELKASVAAELLKQLPLAVAAAAKSQIPVIERIIEEKSGLWKEKWATECDKRRKLHNLVQELRGNIRVYCRVRPLNERESGSCITFPSPNEIQIYHEGQGLRKSWEFNEVFRENSTQEMVFAGIRDLVVSMIDGFNVCIFAYGQTGAGKTHSMQGTKDNPGIYKRTFEELFKVAKERQGWQVELRGALVEIYNDEIRDLLTDPGKRKEKLQVKMSKEGNHVPGLTTWTLSNSEDVENLLDTGSKNRTVAATDMNLHSSRSHLLVQLFGSMVTHEGKKLSSVITLVDLAGSERLAKSGVSGDRAKEAIAINKSLSALGDVINARASKSSHTPFRNSTLTHMLQDSLSGDSKTLMLMQINPCQDYVEESLCSLQFGARVNNVEMKK